MSPRQNQNRHAERRFQARGGGGGGKAVSGEPCLSKVGLGLEGLTRAQRKGCWREPSTLPFPSTVVSSKCGRDTYPAQLGKETRRNQEENCLPLQWLRLHAMGAGKKKKIQRLSLAVYFRRNHIQLSI